MYTIVEKKQKMSYATCEKWKWEFDKEYRTVTWLDYESDMDEGSKVINRLKCMVCLEFCSHTKNFSDKWILSADSIRIRDHDISKQHTYAMNLLKKKTISAAQSVVSNASIVVALNLSEEEKTHLRHKFDIAYFLVIKKIFFISFYKYVS